LFDREEYPAPEELAKKFRFSYTLTPIPTAGDFRIEIGEQAKAELVAQYETAFNERLNHAMRDVWQRLYECLTHMSERLSSDDEGKRKVFHGTILTNAHELVNLLSRLNITNDPQLEQARRELNAALTNTDLDTLKESDYIRENVKAKVDDILKRFEW
jgi:cell division FtsZ-interacting protein ZapD